MTSLSVLFSGNLGIKFLIKSLGNWQQVIKHSGEKLYSTDQSGFDDRIRNLNAENAIYVVADIHGTINSLIKNIIRGGFYF
jgi:hypothetical protein